VVEVARRATSTTWRGACDEQTESTENDFSIALLVRCKIYTGEYIREGSLFAEHSILKKNPFLFV